MTMLPKRKFTVDEFLDWTEGRPGRFELLEGHIFQMSAQRAAHAEVKLAVHLELVQAVSEAAVPCRVMPDGMTVRISDDTGFEPDALIYCGDRVPPDSLEIPNPIIVVEVLSPSTEQIDSTKKLSGYFQVPSIEHYLIVDPGKPPVIHHRRQSDGTILTRLFNAGTIELDPPGIEVDVSHFGI